KSRLLPRRRVVLKGSLIDDVLSLKAAQKYPSSLAARTPVWIQLGSGRYQFYSRSCRRGFGERQPLLRCGDLNWRALTGDLYGREREFDAVLVKRLLDHRQRLAPNDKLLAGHCHHLGPDLDREIAKLL